MRNRAAWMLLFLFVGCTASVEVRHARAIRFAGITWDVKQGEGVEPGPNDWSDSTKSVYVDRTGRLHLALRKVAGRWYCAEVVAQQSFGYGTYQFEVDTDTSEFPDNVVVGLFAYKNDESEIDIELSRWGAPDSPDAQYAVQPISRPGNVKRFDLHVVGSASTHSFVWQHRAIRFASFQGRQGRVGSPIARWLYNGPNVPTPPGVRPSLNIWLQDGHAPAGYRGSRIEVVIGAVSVP